MIPHPLLANLILALLLPGAAAADPLARAVAEERMGATAGEVPSPGTHAPSILSATTTKRGAVSS